MRISSRLNGIRRKVQLSFWLALTLLISQGYMLQDAAGSISYFMSLQPSTLISPPPVTLQNGTDNVSFIYTNSTSAKISINATSNFTTYNYTLEIVNNVSNDWKVRLEVYSSSNISRISNATIILHDNAAFSTQVVVSNGSITQSSGNYYNLFASSMIYIKVENLKESAEGLSLLHAHLRIRKPNTTTYTLYTITFEFT